MSARLGRNRPGRHGHAEEVCFFLPAVSALGPDGEEAAEVAQSVRPGNLVRNLLPRPLKDAAEGAFGDPARLAAMSVEDREVATGAEEQIANL